jgi:GNAT superfamily N-acetyltransferase
MISAATYAECDAAVGKLLAFNFTIIRNTWNLGAAHYVVTRAVDGVVVSVSIELVDHQSGADIIIGAIGVIPSWRRREGFGRRAIKDILIWAKQNALDGDVRATQVLQHSAGFWERCGFRRMAHPNPTGDYRYEA